MPFEHTLLPDEREILQEVVDDFWRHAVYEASPLFVRYLLTMGVDPEQLFDIIRPHIQLHMHGASDGHCQQDIPIR